MVLVFLTGNLFVKKYESGARREVETSLLFTTRMIQNRIVPYLGLENTRDLLESIVGEVMDENPDLKCIGIYDTRGKSYFVGGDRRICKQYGKERMQDDYPRTLSNRIKGKDVVSIYYQSDDLFGNTYYILYVFKTGIFAPLYSLRLYFNLLFVLFLFSEIVLVYVTKKTDEKLARMRETLITMEQSFVMERLAGLLAHELKNPLFVISGNVEMSELPPEEKKVLMDEIIRMKSIIERYEGVMRKSSKLSTDLQEAMNYILQLFGKQFEKKGLSLSAEIAYQGSLHIPFDDFKQIALNIVINALQAGVSLNIKVEKEKDRIKIYFCSPGAPLPENIKRGLFEPYFTTKKEGTGLGLFISRNLARQNQGDLYYSYINGNNCFILEVKRYENTNN